VSRGPLIRVLLADDHLVVRTGLGQLLGSFGDIQVVGAAADGGEAIAMAGDVRPDIVPMDLSMPGIDGVEATHRIVESSPETSVVIFTSFSDRERILAAIGYLMKDAEPDELHRGLLAVARGESPLAPKAASTLISARTERRPTDGLTDREREVLVLLAEGRTNRQIARRLRIAEKTVKAHLTSVFRRIGVADRTQAALWAQRAGVEAAGPRDGHRP
jgi:DNA-binding NarL/FixJ family response regulator